MSKGAASARVGDGCSSSGANYIRCVADDGMARIVRDGNRRELVWLDALPAQDKRAPSAFRSRRMTTWKDRNAQDELAVRQREYADPLLMPGHDGRCLRRRATPATHKTTSATRVDARVGPTHSNEFRAVRRDGQVDDARRRVLQSIDDIASEVLWERVSVSVQRSRAETRGAPRRTRANPCHPRRIPGRRASTTERQSDTRARRGSQCRCQSAQRSKMSAPRNRCSQTLSCSPRCSTS